MRHMFSSERIRLRAFEPGDLPEQHAMVNDEETALAMTRGMPYPSSMEDERQWLSQQSSYTHGEYQFAIESRLTGDLIGRCGVTRLDWKNRVGEMAIMVGKAYQGQGLGTEAMQLLCSFCFRQLNLHRLKMSVLKTNAAAIRCYEKCGFQEEGILREEVFRNGRYVDVVLMGRLCREEDLLDT
ncbi:MAG: GNAT family N-acetyltransferase [Clostridia bacterium]|nr:GNAT family N-acetyltransferase [Clostridia bacterium]